MPESKQHESPGRSGRLYLRLASGDLAVLKFLVEAEDNLAYISTISPHTAVARVVFASERESEVRGLLACIASEVAWIEVETPRSGDGYSRGLESPCN